MKEGTKIKVNLKVKSGGKERTVGNQSNGIGGLNLESDEKKEDGFGEFQDSNW